MIHWKAKRAFLIRKGKIKPRPTKEMEKDIALTGFAIKAVHDLKERATDEEIKFCEFLKAKNIEFVFQHSVVKNGKLFIIDFYLPQLNLGIELDGHYHYTEQGVKSDMKRSQKLLKCGINIIRISNNDVKKFIKVFDLLYNYHVL